MKKSILTLLVLSVASSAMAFTQTSGLFLGTGTTIVLSNTNTAFTGTISIGTFTGGAPDFSSGASSLFTSWIPANLGAIVNSNDAIQSPLSISNYGTARAVTSGTFTNSATITSDLGNDNFDLDDPNTGPASAYVNYYEGQDIYLWISNTTADALGSSTTYSIYKTTIQFDNAFNVSSGVGQAYINVGPGSLTLVKNAGVQVVPEPSTYALVGASVLGLFALRRRNKVNA